MADKKETGDQQAEANKAADEAKSDEIAERASKEPEEAAEEFIEDLEDAEDTLAAEGSETLEAAFSSSRDPETEAESDAAGSDDEPAEVQEDASESETPEGTEPVEDAVLADGDSSDDAAPKDLDHDVIDIPEAEVEATQKTDPEPVAATPPPPPPPVQEVRQVGFVPVVLGGVIAAALGAGALYYSGQQGWLAGGADTDALEATIAAQATEIEALTAALASATEANAEQSAAIEALQGNDFAALEAAITSLSDTDGATQSSVAEVAAALDETRARLAELEVQPIPEAELPAEVTEAYERQLADVLATIEGRFEEMQGGQAETLAAMEADIRQRLAELEAAQAEASATEEAALIAANAAAARAAAAQVSLALDNGEGFAEHLAVLAEKAGVAIPDALSAVADDGVTTLSALQGSFPDVARGVLSEVARDAGADDGGMSPITSIILTQLGARSLEPREGSDPDAVLSRAEAAVKAGELDAALSELAALPEDAQTMVADWVALASTLRDARAASDVITAELNSE